MRGKFDNTKPIYLQILQRLCRQLVRGEIKTGQKLPSIREMALHMGVNPNTIQRVYNELEQMEIAETRRGLGSYVTENEERLSRLREDLKREQICRFVKDMRESGFNPGEIIEGVDNELKIQASKEAKGV
ncbi:MAG: GntR family transcriptional regulator [Peptococcaceae bacterium]|nr:GntR family transcriptional regulator [Peptococcaceae bacterium]